jgi:hypothetical protein
MNREFQSVRLRRAGEQLRQEREIFEQRKSQEARWFRLRLCMGYSSVALLAIVLIVASSILWNHSVFPNAVVISAGIALFTDILTLLLGVWKIVLNPSFSMKLSPTTNVSLPKSF